MIPVRQSTAFETAIGPVLDADGVAVTGGVVGDFKIKKTSGAFAALNGSATLTHVSAGFYDLVLTTSDVDTVGLCCIAIDDTTNACAPLYLQVIEEAVYDALFAASAAGYQVPIWSSAGATVNLSATTIKTATDVETDTADIQSRLPAALVNSRMDCTIDGTGMESGAVDSILNRDASASTTNSTLGAIVNDWENGGRLDLIIDDILVDTGTTLQGELDGIQADTEDIQTRLPAALVAGRMDASVGAMASGVLTATAIASDAFTAAKFAADCITAAKIADGAIDRATFAADTGLQTIRSGTAQAGAAGTITLDASASSTANFYKGQLIYTTGGTGAGQVGLCFSYDGTTKVATMYNNWVTAPDNTTTFAIKDFYGHGINSSLQAISDVQSIGGTSGSNVTGISSLGTAYDAGTLTTNITGNITGNLSGSVGSVTGAVGSVTGAVGSVTGNVGGNVVGSVASVTGNVGGNVVGSVASVTGAVGSVTGAVGSVTATVSADMVSVSGDSTAADNLESYLDGTHFMPVDAHKPVFSVSGATLTVKRPDGTTTAYTRTLTSDAAANPITGSS